MLCWYFTVLPYRRRTLSSSPQINFLLDEGPTCFAVQDATGKAADIAVGWAIGVGAPFAFGEDPVKLSQALLTKLVCLQ